MKKTLLAIIFVIFTLNCFAITIFLKDNNQLTGEIKKIDKQKIYVSPCYSKVLFIVKKSMSKRLWMAKLTLPSIF